MPIYHHIQQRSEQWFALRVGMPTASDFSDLITPGGKPSKSADGLLCKLLAEAMMGHEIKTPVTAAMLNGIELEPKAIAAYEFETDCKTDDGGFFTDDEARYGASPDRIVGTDGLLECKCPSPAVHMGYLIDPGSMARDKAPQVQGQLLVTGRAWVDLTSYHPEMPLVIARVLRDEEYIGKLKTALDEFTNTLKARRKILEVQYGPFPQNDVVDSPAEDALGVSDSDVDQMLKAGVSTPQS